MAFKDYSTNPSENTALGDGTYIGPNMLRNKVRPALQQIAADGRDVYDELIGEIAAIPAGPPGDVGRVADRTALAALVGTTTNTTRYLSESGREGLFVFDDSNLSTLVTADTAQGIYVAPAIDTTGASGAWVRQFDTLVFDWFGAVPGDYTTGNSPDCVAAWNAMQSYLNAVDRNVSASYIANGPKVLFPGAQYCFSDKIVLNRALHLIGQGASAGSEATWLKWTGGTGGLVINRSGSTYAGEVSADSGGGGSLIEGFLFQGPGGTPVGAATAELLYSAIRFKDRAEVRNCMFRNWRGAGLCISASTAEAVSSAFYGNVNGVIAANIRIEDCSYNGVWVSGGDANVIKLSDVDVSECGRFGFWLDPFLGVKLDNCQVAHCGTPSHSGLSEYSLVHLAGVQYYAKYDASTATLQAETPGTGSNWIRYGTGGASADIPTWTGAHAYVPGGSYGGPAAFCTLVGCYYETGQAPPQLPGAMSMQGFMGTGISDIPQIYSGADGIFLSKGLIHNKTYTDASTVRAKFGGYQGNTWFDLVGYQSSASTSGFDPQRLTAFAVEKATGDVGWYTTASASNFEAGTVPTFRLTGVSTARTYGGRPQSESYGIVEVKQLALGDANNARVLTSGSAVPSTGYHAQGEYQFNRSVTATVPIGWGCVASGTSGTHIADYLYARADPATGVGYVTGAGGAVTQITSRATAVTLDRPCGAITLFSAAGSATWQSFTVNNSTVGANDTIRVVQKSGTDLYMIHVTAVAAGSFRISFATTGGTTTEQPVFNYTVHKGANS